jgi:hypothetical protein
MDGLYGLDNGLVSRLADCGSVGMLWPLNSHLLSIRLNRRRARQETARAQVIPVSPRNSSGRIEPIGQIPYPSTGPRDRRRSRRLRENRSC